MPNTEFDLGGINHLALVSSDMQRTIGFYSGVLGMPLIKTIDLPGNMGQHSAEVHPGVFVLGGGRVPDGVFDVLKGHLPEKEILQLTYIACMYGMHATMSRVLRLECGNRDEPAVEVAAPEGYGSRGISADLTAGS